MEEDQTPIELSAPDAALLGIILSLTILGEVDDVKPPISQSFAHIYVFRNSRSLVTAQTWTRVKWFHKLGRADSDKEGWHSSHQSLLFKKNWFDINHL